MSYESCVDVLSHILETDAKNIKSWLTIYIKLTNEWVRDDYYHYLVDDTRVIFDGNSRIECIWLIRAVSVVCNHVDLFPGMKQSKILLGCLHYIMAMSKYQASGVDPNILPDSDLCRIGLFLASHSAASPVRRQFIHFE